MGASKVRLRLHPFDVVPCRCAIGMHLLTCQGALLVHEPAFDSGTDELILEVPREIDEHPIALRVSVVEEPPHGWQQLAVSYSPNVALVDNHYSERRKRRP